MAMKITNDPLKLYTSLQLSKTDQSLAATLAKLSSGSRINQAADDASSMTISDSMGSDIRGLGQMIRNASDNIAMAQITEGALREATDILQNVRVKALQAAQDGQSAESRKALQADISRSLAALDTLAETTTYNGKPLISGMGSLAFATGRDTTTNTATSSGTVLNSRAALTIDQTTTSTLDSTLAQGSVLAVGTILKSGSTVGFTADDSVLAGDITTTAESTLAAGSTLATGSTIKRGSTLGGDTTIQTTSSTTIKSVLESGSLLTAGSRLAAGTEITTRFTANSTTYEAGTTLQSDVVLTEDVTLSAQMTAAASSQFAANTVLGSGSSAGADLTTQGTTVFANQSKLAAGSVIRDAGGTALAAGSKIGGDVTISAPTTVNREMTAKTGSELAIGSELARGSTLGAMTTIAGPLSTAGEMTIGAGSSLAEGSILKKGTALTNDIWTTGDVLMAAGTVLSQDVVTSGTNYLYANQTLKADSILMGGSRLAPVPGSLTAKTADNTAPGPNKISLSQIDVTSQAGAEEALAVTDQALQYINGMKSNLGAAQNQLYSNINNLSTTMINLSAAKSSVSDVDYAELAMELFQTKLANQAQIFAQVQSGGLQKKNILELLQG